MSSASTFGIVVGYTFGDNVHIGLPDVRGGYHQILLNQEQVDELMEQLERRKREQQATV